LLTAAVLLAAVSCDKGNETATPSVATPNGVTPPASVDEIVAQSNLPATLDAALPQDDMGVTVHRLSNGLTVYISTERQKPRISAWVAVRTGSRNDPADSTGLAHYLEHMLFKGTSELGTLDFEKEKPHLDRIAELYDQLRTVDSDEERAKVFAEIDAETQKSAAYAVPNEIDRLYASMGITGLNAFTNFDATVYIADLPANRFEAWATVEGRRYADPAFRLFYPELEAVYEEKNRAIDSPFRAVWEKTLQGLFPDHPYGTQTTIGEVEHLKVPAYCDMVAYFERWYGPNNMAVVLAGDIDPKTALPVLERTLGQLQPRALEPPAPGGDTGPKGRQLSEVTVEGENSVAIAWRTVAASHADAPALEVMDWVMDNGQAGLLNVELELPQRVPDASSGHSTMNEAGYWTLRATAKEGQSHEEVEQLLLGVVAKLKQGAFEQSDVDAVILQTIKNDAQALEFAQARVSRMQDAFINRMNWTDWVAAHESKRNMKKADLVRVAKEYLGDDFVVVYRKKGKPDLPKIEKPSITPVEIDNTRQSPFAKRVSEMPAAPLEPEWLEDGKQYTVRDLPAGRLIAAHNETNDLFSISYAFDRGTRQDALLCLAFDALEASGTEQLDAQEVQKKIYALGSSIGFGCSDDGSSIRISGFDEKMEETLALLEQWMAGVKIEDEQLAKLVENEISQRRDNLEDPRWLGFALSEYAQFGKDSAFLAEPSNKQLQRAKGAKLAKTIREAPNYQHTTLYFGPRDAEAASQAIALGEKHRKVAPPKPRRYRKQKGDRIYFVSDDVAKSSVSLAMPIGVAKDEKRGHARLLSEYFGGGMSSAIFQEIREARGLAYFARGWMSEGNREGDDWAFSGQMDTQSDKTIEAIEVYVDLVRARALDPSRTDSAKESLEQDYRSSRVEPRFVAFWVDSWFDRGDESDPRPEIRQAAKALDNEGLQAFADELDGVPLIISVLGNGEKLDKKALAEIAPVTELEPEVLFSWGAFPKQPEGESKANAKAEAKAKTAAK